MMVLRSWPSRSATLYSSRVPLIFVSGYGQQSNGQCIGYIRGITPNASEQLDFGTIANFIEYNFLGSKSREGLLGFADARALLRSGTQDLTDFYNPSQTACPFASIPTLTGYGASYFIHDQSTVQPPDDD